MRDVVMTAVRPLLLGGGRVARETAVRFFLEYRVFSVLLDRKRPLFSLFTSFTQLPDTRSDEFLLMSLGRAPRWRAEHWMRQGHDKPGAP